jgi:hypothetical protein
MSYPRPLTNLPPLISYGKEVNDPLELLKGLNKGGRWHSVPSSQRSFKMQPEMSGFLIGHFGVDPGQGETLGAPGHRSHAESKLSTKLQNQPLVTDTPPSSASHPARCGRRRR